ncbi:Kynurenine 3monooxygenase, partial [Caligus rogercresseyi]
NGKELNVEADFVIGCDGAYSTVRKFIMKSTVFDYEQKYIPHAYKELCLPPTKDGDFAMDPEGLHIWPRNQFMMIALPNQDRSFTMTLFMPFDTFNSIVDEDSLLDFFGKYFADSIPLIGKERLIADYFAIKDSPLVSIK